MFSSFTSLPQRARHQRGFTLVEVLVYVAIAAVLMSGLAVLYNSETQKYAAARDMDRLERWINSALSRADLWKCGFSLIIYLPQGADEKHYFILRWLNTDTTSLEERFYSDENVRWSINTSTHDIIYRWATHSVSPAFVILAKDRSGILSGETLTVSLRGLVTRGRAGD